MAFVGFAVLVLAVPFAVLTLVGALVAHWRSRRGWRFVRRAGVAFVLLLPIHLLVVVPGILGWLGSHVRTRSFEQGYEGPPLGPDGARISPTFIESADGLHLRIFHVPAKVEPPPAGSWVLVHGLFRNAFELEPVATMFHELGAEVVLLEVRNHGGSERAPATFGLRESDDVVAAAEWLRARGRTRIGLFGVSLGSVSVALAAPRVEGLEAVVLDAPIDALRDTGERMLSSGPRRAPHFAIPWPINVLAITAVELWSGIDLDDVQPYEAMRNLPAEVAVLLVGAGEDLRAPPYQVRALGESLPTNRIDVWIRDGSTHGRVWIDDPAGYRARLAGLLRH